MATLTVAPRTYEQRMEALARANEIRTVRRILKAEIRTGEQQVRDVLMAEIPVELESMKIWDLLGSLRGWGPERLRRVMNGAGMSHSRTLGGATARQRRALVALVALEERRLERYRARPSRQRRAA